MNALGKGKYVVCQVADLTIGIELDRVQEINRLVDVTEVPRAPTGVRGVVNLRGNLVTVLDLSVLLLGKPTTVQVNARTVVIDLDEERVGVLVERVGDVVDCNGRAIEPLPRHVARAHARWFQGLIQTEQDLLLVLDVDGVCDPRAVTETHGAGVA